MGYNTYFFGQSVFGQLISLIDTRMITRNSAKHNADRYIKRFTTKDHLISMLFGVFAKITSLREVSGAMLGLSGKISNWKVCRTAARFRMPINVEHRMFLPVFTTIY